MMISLSLDNISTFGEYKKDFKLIVKEYNSRYQESINTSPKHYLKNFLTLGNIINENNLQIDVLKML